MEVPKKLGQGADGQVRRLVSTDFLSLATQYQRKHQAFAKHHNRIVPRATHTGNSQMQQS